MPLKEYMQRIEKLVNADVFDVHQLDQLFNEDNVNDLLPDGWTPLTYAIQRGNIQVVNYLIYLGADLNLPGPEKRLPIVQAVLLNKADIVDEMIKNKVNIPLYTEQRKSFLNIAIQHHMTNLVYKLIEHIHANVNEVDHESHTTPLIRAAEVGGLDVVKLLVRKGAKVNLTPVSGLAPLASAAIHQHLAVVHYFLQMKADVEQAKQSIKSRLEAVLKAEPEDVEEQINALRSGFEMILDAVEKEENKTDISKNRFEFFNARNAMNKLRESDSESPTTSSVKDKRNGG